MFASLGAAGIGLILGGIVIICIWKDHGKKAPAWLALVAGMFLSLTVVGWLGGLAAMSILGVAITTVVLIFGGLVFWLEAVKNKKWHKYRTPVIGFAVGVALTASFGGVQHAVQQGTVNLTSVITHATGKR
jgi:hypothetical protein